jgi:hypothetical protein
MSFVQSSASSHSSSHRNIVGENTIEEYETPMRKGHWAKNKKVCIRFHEYVCKDYICVGIKICVYIFICIYIYIYIYVYIYVSVYTYVCIYMHIFTYIYMYVCKYICLCI